MAKYLLRFEHVLFVLVTVVFWGFDLLLLWLGIRMNNGAGFYDIHLFVFPVFLFLAAIPWFAFYRLRTNDVTIRGRMGLYLGVTIVLLIGLVLIFRVVTFFNGASLDDTYRVFGSMHSAAHQASGFLEDIFLHLLIIYILLQVVVITGAIRRIRKRRRAGLELIANIGNRPG